MKDFAKSIRTGNETAEERLGLNPIIEGVTKDIIEIYKKNGKNRELTKKELIERHHLTEKQAEEALRKIVGNSKVGNADPRIQAFKSKIPALEKQGDIGALKDIYHFVDDMIKSLNKRKEELARELAKIDKDIGSYIDLRSELKYKI